MIFGSGDLAARSFLDEILLELLGDFIVALISLTDLAF
jgi:hypothetical protein